MEIVQATRVRGQQVFKTKTGQIIKQGRRPVKSGSSYNHLVNTSDVQFTSSLTYGNVDKTVKLMAEIIENYHYQLKDLALHLKRDTELQTCKAVWDFVFNHIQYKRDKVGIEQLTTPARIWLNRSTEGTPSDCDDHSIFVGSLLYQLGIPFTIRIAGYEGKKFSHVYIVTKGNICLDTVLHAFNKEAFYTSKKDSKMMQIEVLHGFGGVGTLGELGELGDLGFVSSLASSVLNFQNRLEQDLPNESYFNNYQENEEINGFNDVSDNLINSFKNLGKEQLEITLKAYEEEPELYHAKGFSPDYWRLMYKAYKSFENSDLDGIIVNLTNGAEWEKQNLSSLNGVADESGEVTGLMGFMDGLFKKIRRGFKKFGKWTKKTVKKAVKWVGGFLKKVSRFMMKINPIMIGVRTILRFKINKNKKDLAITLGLGLMTSQQAAQAGISKSEHDKAKRALAKFIKKYRFLGGKTSKLKSVIAKAYRKHAKGVNLPDVSLRGLDDLEGLEGRRRRRRRRRRRARRALTAKKSATQFRKEKSKILNKKMSKFKREQLEFLKVAFKDEAKRQGLADPATAGSAAAAVPIATKIINWILKMLGKLGLKKVITKLKEKRIAKLAEKAKKAVESGATDLAKKYLDKKKKAENNLVIFNNKSKPIPTPASKEIPKENITSSSGKVSTIVPTDTTIMATSKSKQAGMNPLLIGGLILVAGGALFYGSKDDKKKKKEPKQNK